MPVPRPAEPLSFQTPHGSAAVTSIRSYPARPPGRHTSLILAHGAGAGHDSAFMVSYAEELAARGLDVTTFNFLYFDRNRRMPDSKDMLEACWLAAIRHVRDRAGADPIFIGGKSMGGRIASQVAAAGDMAVLGVKGLVFLGYPLHLPGQPGTLRVAHWPDIGIPALFVQGSRDAFGTPHELRAALPRFGAPATLHVVEGGDHSFKVTRASQAAQDAVHARAHVVIVEWIGLTLSGGTAASS
jgi:predicted alpha/beta-hydrolase family hydrolase